MKTKMILMIFVTLTALTFAIAQTQGFDQRLCESSKIGDLNGVVKAIKDGANVNQTEGYGSTAIIYAVQGKNCDCVKVLLENVADPNIRNLEAWTPLL